MKITAIPLLLTLLLFGCANSPGAGSPSGIKVERDDFQKSTYYEGAEFSSDPARSGNGVVEVIYLRGTRFDQKATSIYQVYVMDYISQGWRNYSTALDSDGKSLSVTKISRGLGRCTSSGCPHEEHLAINLPEDYLIRHAATGMSFQISGTGGKEVFTISPSYIQNFISVAGKPTSAK